MGLNSKVIKAIKAIMEDQGVSVNALAHTTGIAQPTLNRAFREETDLTIDRFGMICEALDINTVEFFRKLK